MFFKWFSRTRMSQNWTLIGCLVETDQHQHLKLSPQSLILFYKVFFLTRNTFSSSGKCLWKEPFKLSVPPDTHFFWSPYFKIWEWMLSRYQKEGGSWYCDNLVLILSFARTCKPVMLYFKCRWYLRKSCFNIITMW